MISKLDEYAETLEKMTAFNAPPVEQGKIKVQNELWSTGFAQYKTLLRSQKTDTTIYGPHFSIIAAAPPRAAQSVFTDKLRNNGFTNRWIIVSEIPTNDLEAQKHAEDEIHARMTGSAQSASTEPPENLIRLVQHLFTRRDREERASKTAPSPSLAATSAAYKPAPARVLCDDMTADLFRSYRRWAKNLNRENESDGVYFVRAAETALRIATILAVGDRTPERDPGTPVMISCAQMEWALRFSDWCCRQAFTMGRQYANHDSNSGLQDEVVEYIKKRGSVTRRQLVNTFRKKRGMGSIRNIDDMLKLLAEGGAIVSSPAKNNRTVVYRASVKRSRKEKRSVDQ
jgi:hypothetical protein